MYIVAGLIVLGLVALAAMIAYQIMSSRQADRYAAALLRDRDKLVKLAGQGGPQEFEQAVLKAGAAEGTRLTPKARSYVTNRVRAEMAEHISKLCLKNWRASQAGSASKVRAFVVHDYMGGFELSESIADADAYELLSAHQREWLDDLDDDLPPGVSMRERFAEQLAAGDPATAKIRRAGTTDAPVAGDIYVATNA